MVFRLCFFDCNLCVKHSEILFRDSEKFTNRKREYNMKKVGVECDVWVGSTVDCENCWN